MTKPEGSKEDDAAIEEIDLSEGPSSCDKVETVFLTISVDDASDTDNEENKTDGEPSPKKPRRYVQKYKKEWENKPALKAWLSESIHGNTYFYCKFCKKDYRCGISDIQKHMSSKKHTQRATQPNSEAKNFTFSGLLCPVFTPFHDAKKIVPDVNYQMIQKYADFLEACNVKGLLINDYIGEGMSLTTGERMCLTETWMKACEKNKQFLMVQIGGAPLKEVFVMAAHAKKTEVGAVVVLPDVYSRPKTHLDLIKYIKLISEHSKSVPILYHHNPKYTQVEIDIPAFLLEITDEVDSFAGLIYTTNDLKECLRASSVNAEKYTIFMGTDEVILGAAASGLRNVMATSLNFLPKIVESMCEAVSKGNLKSAQGTQTFLNKTTDAILKHGDPVAALKAATEIITKGCGCATREPVQSLWEGTVKKLNGILIELGVI